MKETYGIVIQLTDDLALLTGHASYIYIIIYLCNDQILKRFFLGCFRGGVHLIITEYGFNNTFNLFGIVRTCGQTL